MSTPPSLPTLPGLSWSRHKKPGFKTRVASHVSGREVRVAYFVNPLYEFEATYSGMTSAVSGGFASGLGASSLQAMMGCFLQMQGQFGTFLYADPDDTSISAGAIATGDGSTQAFLITRVLGGFTEPVSWVMGVTAVYLNGVSQPSADWMFTAPNMLAFATAPGAGVAITADFTFAFQCRFLDDQLDFEEFMSSLWKLDSLKFRSVKANTVTTGALIPTWYSPYFIGSSAPYGFADFSTEGGSNHYLWNGTGYTSGAAWLTAAGGTYANSSGKYITNASGLLASGAANTLPFDYSPTSVGTCLGLLLEGASTNLLVYSQNLSNAAWNAVDNITVTAAAATAPDGTSTANLLVPSASATYHGVGQSLSLSNGQAYTISGFFKNGGYRYGAVTAYLDGGSQVFTAVIDTTTGSITTTTGTAGSGGVASGTLLANGWVRCQLTITLTTGSGGNVYVSASDSGTPTFEYYLPADAGNGTSGVYAWGAQIEALSFASSYIPTTSAPASRAADSLYLPWTLTTFAARVKATMTAEVDNGRLLGAGSGGLLYQSSGPDATTNNGSNTLAATVNAWASQNIVVLGGSASGRVLSANGHTAATDAHPLVPSAPSDIYLGVDSAGSNPSDGHFAQFGLWNVAPTAAQAATLSGTA